MVLIIHLGLVSPLPPAGVDRGTAAKYRNGCQGPCLRVGGQVSSEGFVNQEIPQDEKGQAGLCRE